jgi:hypothetical protein
MRRTFRFCLVFAVLAGMVNVAAAQYAGPGFGPGPAIQAPSSFMSMPSFFPQGLQGAVSLGDFVVRPEVRVGYQKIGLNFNIPAFSQLDSMPAPIDLSVKDANVWVGAVRLEVDFWRNWFLFGSLEGNAQRNVTVFTYDQLLSFYGLAPYQWNATGLQWWDIDAGIGYKFCPQIAIVFGSRWDHLFFTPDAINQSFGCLGAG